RRNAQNAELFVDRFKQLRKKGLVIGESKRHADDVGPLFDSPRNSLHQGLESCIPHQDAAHKKTGRRRYPDRDPVRGLPSSDGSADMCAVLVCIEWNVRLDPVAQRVNDEKILDASIQCRVLSIDSRIEHCDIDVFSPGLFPDLWDLKLLQAPGEPVLLLPS